MGIRLFGSGVALALLCGCGATVVSSSPRTVVVDGGIPPNRNGAQAQALADAECARHGRYARMVARPVYDQSKEYVFDCVQ